MRPQLVLSAIARETRGSRGRIVFFALSLALGAAAVAGVSGLVDAVEEGLAEESRRLLAADLRVGSRAPLTSEQERELARELALTGGPGLRRTQLVELASMVAVSERRLGSGDAPPAEGATAAGGTVLPHDDDLSSAESRLVEVKAVGELYPLHGELATDPPDARAELDAHDALIGPELARSLGLGVGDEIALGEATFRVAGLVLDEPDRLEFTLTLGPRVIVTLEGLARTDLLSFGSRVRYRELVELPELASEELAELAERIEEELPGGELLRVETRDGAQRNVEEGLERVEKFVGLAALLALVLSGVGVAQIVRAWIAERTSAVAVLRCIGYRPREILVLYLAHIALLALAASTAGALLGALLPLLAPLVAPEFLPPGMASAWQPAAFARAVALALGVALAFALPPLTAVWRVSPARVLRAEAEPLKAPRAVRWASLALAAAGVLGAAWVQARDLAFAASFAGILLAVAAVLFLAARALLWVSRRVARSRVPAHLLHGCAALGRPSAGTTGAIAAFGLGVLVVVGLALVELVLERELSDALPANAPTAFLIDVQPAQWEGVRELLAEEGASEIDSVPVVTARLSQLDGTPVGVLAEEREGHRERWVLSREQRLTWMEELPPDNLIVAGELWSDPLRREASLEQGYAEDLGAEVGTELVFDVQGVPVELLVTSLRTVEWESFAINFFVVVEPGALEGAPHWRLAAARLPAASETSLQDRVVAAFPNVTVLCVRPILEKVRGALAKAALGVRVLGGFTIAVGIAVLAGAIGASNLRRAREAALWKTLGLTRRGVALLFGIEYALMGLVAGVVGTACAYGAAWLFLEHGLELEPELPLLPLPVALVASALVAALAGTAASARALAAPPLASLRG